MGTIVKFETATMGTYTILKIHTQKQTRPHSYGKHNAHSFVEHVKKHAHTCNADTGTHIRTRARTHAHADTHRHTGLLNTQTQTHRHTETLACELSSSSTQNTEATGAGFAIPVVSTTM